MWIVNLSVSFEMRPGRDRERLRLAVPLCGYGSVMDYTTLRVSVDGPVGHIVLDRPSRLNAIDLDMLDDLIAAARWFDEQLDVRVVVVEGSGEAFCAGYDIDGFEQLSEDAVERRVQSAKGGAMANALESMRAVTVAKLHGWVVGGGVVIAAACDLRVAADNTRFKIPEVQLGIALNWGGIPRLVREIGPALTKELVMTCREFSAGEAKTAGFLNRVVPPEQLTGEVDELADTLVRMPSVPVLATKDQVNAVTRAMAARIGHYMDGEGMTAAMQTDEFRDAFLRYRASLESD